VHRLRPGHSRDTGSTLVAQGGLGFVRENGIEGDNGGYFRKVRRLGDDVVVTTPDYAICHEMKREEDTRSKGSVPVSAFPYLG
jgi:hypothetical protein